MVVGMVAVLMPQPLSRALVICLTACVLGTHALGDTRLGLRFKGGIPQSTRFSTEVHHRRGYSIGFSPELRQSVWIAYRLTPEDVSDDVGRMGRFLRDYDLSEVLSPSRYAGSGYDRGHMAPSIDMRYSEEVSRQSFWMGNISPQTPILNRGEWKRLESQIHRLALREINDEPSAYAVYVIAGPIFGSDIAKNIRQVAREGKAPFLVPERFFKVYICNGKATAFLFSQNGTPPQRTSIHDIETLTGLSLFPEMDVSLRAVYSNMTYGK